MFMPMSFILFSTGLLQAVFLYPTLFCSGSVRTLFPLPFCIPFLPVSVLSMLHIYFAGIPHSSEVLFEVRYLSFLALSHTQFSFCSLMKVLVTPNKQECLTLTLSLPTDSEHDPP